MKITATNFLPIFIIVLAVMFGLHLSILHFMEHPFFSDKIIESYLLNSLVAIFIYYIINTLKTKFKNSLGFIFIFGGLLKFLLFYILIYPSFKLDGTISNFEFAAFFIPYFTCLIYETLAIATLLNNLKN